MAENWTEWVIDRDAGELVGPCGCRVPNTFDGLQQTRDHECADLTSRPGQQVPE